MYNATLSHIVTHSAHHGKVSFGIPLIVWWLGVVRGVPEMASGDRILSRILSLLPPERHKTENTTALFIMVLLQTGSSWIEFSIQKYFRSKYFFSFDTSGHLLYTS
ncbi:hypothetical protein BJ138DRAFT_456616 [Hygrophoropsis aurantiaca]|uniref:Uncharacterized protein n=1 Tax=Hygrophoropsis aurantiaca TaxID=72124 RepID=A0ACB8A3P0_9AGAM|nr:hypothetical protein BJ138DRAFT_456616 [Hygrophoropsis aurantiaca]